MKKKLSLSRKDTELNLETLFVELIALRSMVKVIIERTEYPNEKVLSGITSKLFSNLYVELTRDMHKQTKEIQDYVYANLIGAFKDDIKRNELLVTGACKAFEEEMNKQLLKVNSNTESISTMISGLSIAKAWVSVANLFLNLILLVGMVYLILNIFK